MTKAEEAALKAYPIKDYTKEPNYLHTCDSKMLDEVYRDVFKLGYTQAEKDLGPKWHKSTETPKPDTEVLAEVKGFEHNRFAILKWTKEGWWQHIPRMNDIMPSDGWIGTQGLFVIRWAYIEQ